MAFQSDVGICNLALDKLGADPIASIAAPKTPNERLFARKYPHHRDLLLRKHRWLFSMDYAALTVLGTPKTITGPDGPNTLTAYQMPIKAVRAVRESGTTWVVRGRTLVDPCSTGITAKFVFQTAEALFDETFIEVFACALAFDCCEKVTSSNAKKQDLAAELVIAYAEARKINAFEVGPESYEMNDDAFSFISSRGL